MLKQYLLHAMFCMSQPEAKSYGIKSVLACTADDNMKVKVSSSMGFS